MISILSLCLAWMAWFPMGVQARKKNIVVILTDDQDQTLGGSFPTIDGITPMPKTEKLMFERGAHAKNFVIHTPICCPSRATTWTGRYLHNVKKPVQEKQCGAAYNGQDDHGNACCMHVDEVLVNNFTIAKYLKEKAGYKVGLFGKYLNVCPENPPPGVDAYFANGGGTYYAPSFSVKNIDGLQDGQISFNDTDYSTSLIGNYSLDWIEKVGSLYVETNGSDPFFAFIGTKANHDPFLPAPWYRDSWSATFPDRAPRTPNWNVSHETLALHHPTISAREPFGESTAACIDANFKDRWRCLMSVDDIIGDLFKITDGLGITDETYFFFTSDHGYQLGQLNLNWDKRNVYESNIRIHLLIRGPDIFPGSHFEFPATNVDLAPTILEIAGVDTNDVDMDGRSFLKMLTNNGTAVAAAVADAWRDHVFIEYYYVGLGDYCGMQPIELPDNNFLALRHFPPSKFGNSVYAEFQNGTDGNIAFDDPFFFELFDIDSDPWQLRNIYNDAKVSDETRKALHTKVQDWLHCKGDSCP